ncbi:MAG: ribosome biogenesis GTPase Der [bacterium]|nr:MAG: ribosome biogenesis GTPase Der [bacterium]
MTMPVVAIVGRPNVGKSTLFNRILGRRQAIVEDEPGVTRDRNYGAASWAGREFTLVDTGGLDPLAEEGLFTLTRQQALVAVQEADVILFVVDTRSGLTATDDEVARLLRRTDKPVVVIANKSEGQSRELESSQFYSLGLGEVFPVSALHGTGVAEALEHLVEVLPEKELPAEESHDIRVAVVGRPNTGKSTLINRILGEERVLVSEVPGTTADTVDTLVVRGERRYLFVDTAGVRRKARVSKGLEHYSVLRALSAVERCQVCLLLVEGQQGMVDQDLRIAGLVEERGRGLVLCLNKWDLVEKDHRTFDAMAREIREKMFFFAHAPIISISALTGLRVERIFEVVEDVYRETGRQLTTRQVNEVVLKAVERFQPHLVRGRRLKFYYATQVGVHPPTFVIFTNRPGEIKDSYIRYLERTMREEFGFVGTPIRLRFKRGREDRKKSGR